MITNIILGVIILICVYIIIVQYKKLVAYESFAADSLTRDENSKALLERLIQLYTEAAQKMKTVDDGGSFSSDDEVGFAFKLIAATIIDLTERLHQLKEITDGSEEEG